MLRRVCFSLVIVLFSAGVLGAGNIYAIIFANTEDEGIGCIYDVLNMGNILKNIQKETGLTLNASVYLTVSKVDKDRLASIKTWATVNNGWSKAELDKALAAIKPTQNDVFIFYYSGHGGRMSNKKNQWPDMALQKDNLVDLSYPATQIKAKGGNPRLILNFGDCCNSYMDRSVSQKSRARESSAGFKTLFLSQSGTIIASGSEPGQYSLGGSDGGVFTNAVARALYNPANADWNSVLSSARNLASKETDGEQLPQFQVNGQLVAATTTANSSGATASTGTTSTADASAQDDGNEDDPAASDEQVSADYITFVKNKMSATRKPSGLDESYLDVKSATLDAAGKNLIVTYEIAKNFPSKLNVNLDDTPDDSLEYDWAAYIDADGDGTEDHSIDFAHFKPEGESSASVSFAKACDPILYELGEDGNWSYVDAELTATVKGTKLTVTLTNYKDYFTLGKKAQGYFYVMSYSGGEIYLAQ